MNYKSYKVRIYPTKQQEQIINQTIGNARFIYNKMLIERQEVYKLLKHDKKKLYAYKYKTEKQYKEEFPFLADGSSRALQSSKINLYSSFRNFFKNISGKRKGGKIGFPVLKKKSKVKWSYREPNFEVPGKNKNYPAIEIIGTKLKLNKVGKIKFRGLPEDFHGKICNVTVTRNRDNTYSASILVEQEQPTKKLRTGVGIVGLDLGLLNFVTLSNGEIYKGVKKELKKISSIINSLHRHFSRKQQGSNRREKSRIKLARAYQKRTNILDNFQWKLANHLCSENQAIVIEDLAVKNMVKNRKLSKEISLVGWSKFIYKLKTKAEEYGTSINEAGRFYASSKICSSCGDKKDISLDERVYSCECGLTIDRDINAAINLKRLFYKSAESVDNNRGETVRPTKVVYNRKGGFLRSDDLVLGIA